ncbi:MAG: FAD-binding oxidoreductase [Thiobacillaceae bacterium]
MTTPLPPELLAELRAVVGEAHVHTGDDERARRSRCTIPWQSRCAAVVYPGTTEEVARVLRLANRHRLPVWPYSTGRNWGYGTTLAPQDGAIVMVLARMDRILEVNEALAYAVVEPGVTYAQLNAYLKRHGHRLWVDCIDGTPHGSVIGNALERGVGETPYGDHYGNLCGLEVVLPTGEVVAIGGSGGKTWHTHKWGVGPYLEGLFSQSNLGVVTRAGIWLMPEPEAYNAFVFELGHTRHFTRVLDAFRELALAGVVSAKLHMINDVVSLTLLTQLAAEGLPTDAPLGEAELAALRRKYRIAPWSCGGGLYGSAAQVRLQRRLLKKAVGGYGKLLFIDARRLALLERLIAWSQAHPLVRRAAETLVGTSLPVMQFTPYVYDILRGIPSEYFVRHAYFRNRSARPDADVDPAADGCGLTWFAPILPMAGSEVEPYLADCRRRFAAHGFDFYCALLLMNPRSVICLMAILHDRAVPAQGERARALYDELVTAMQAAGHQQYRVGLMGWPRIFATAPALAALNGRLKAALDPAGILAPGRYGIGGEGG